MTNLECWRLLCVKQPMAYYMLEDWKFFLASRQQAACGKLERAPALQIEQRFAQKGHTKKDMRYHDRMSSWETFRFVLLA
jgi:hypothetical protein